MKYFEQQKAIELRKKGISLKDISEKLNVAKSSVSLWVKDIVLDEKTKKELFMKGFSRDVIEKRRDSRIKNENKKKNKIIEEAGKDFTRITTNELKIIGCMLYFAEGGKSQKGMVRLSNSDPEVIKIMMRFFREICLVPGKKFRGHIHTHSINNVKIAEDYWSKITNISTNQFFKTYTKLSKSGSGLRHTLPYGTFDIYVCDTVLFLKIMGWIKKISSLINSK